MLLQALRGCMELSEINVHGNPVNEEPQINSHFLSILPTLRLMNGKLVLQQTEEKVNPNKLIAHIILCNLSPLL